MENKKKKKNYLVILLFILFIFFLAIYSSQITGAYEYGLYKKSLITDQKIIEFEEDLKNKENILNKIYNKPHKEYSNSISNIGYRTSTYIEKTFTKGIKEVFKYLSKLVLE